MKQHLAHIAIVVDDYDRAIAFYTQVLHFTLIEDTMLSDTKRWVVVSPKGANECSLLLAKGTNKVQKSRIGNQTGGRVFLFLHTDNFQRDYQNLLEKNVKIIREPVLEDYGKVAVFEDLFGNLWDLIEPKNSEELFYSTAILKIKDTAKFDLTIAKLKKLRNEVLLESGNISYEIHQAKDNPIKIALWGCFKNEQAFDEHLASGHLQEFFHFDLVEIENGFVSNHIL